MTASGSGVVPFQEAIVPMIASIKRPKSKSQVPAWHSEFLGMLPAIRRQAQISFRYLPPESREELVAAVIANCLVAFARLVQLGKQDLAYPSALARYGVAQVRAGRRVGARLRNCDALSEHAQRRKGFVVHRLDHFDCEESQWEEIVVEDHRAGPAEIAACRIDFSNWLRLLPARLRKIALTLAGGETTSEAAKKFGVTAARISQLRLWLKENWSRFQGEADVEEQARLAVA
jgi:hypothetical protein